jgi:predicted nucleotidyltransferase
MTIARATTNRSRARTRNASRYAMLWLVSAHDPLVDRLAAAQREARERARRLRAVVPELAYLLRSRGARRVRLFGSLATGAEPHAGTDVDLCVEGLDDSAIADATSALEAMAGARVDLVRWESATERLRRRVDRDGVELVEGAR